MTILTLALGIGANTAIFSVVNGVMLKPLGYPNPERLMFITSTFPALGFDRFWVSLPEWAEFKERNRSFQGVGGYREGAVNLGTPERPRRVNSAIVTPELLDVLGVAPLRGRLFNEADAPSAPRTSASFPTRPGGATSAAAKTSSAGSCRSTARRPGSSASCRRDSTSTTSASRSSCR